VVWQSPRSQRGIPLPRQSLPRRWPTPPSITIQNTPHQSKISKETSNRRRPPKKPKKEKITLKNKKKTTHPKNQINNDSVLWLP
ncbi:hypothetical protein, partial [Enterobacter asburiae]